MICYFSPFARFLIKSCFWKGMRLCVFFFRHGEEGERSLIRMDSSKVEARVLGDLRNSQRAELGSHCHILVLFGAFLALQVVFPNFFFSLELLARTGYHPHPFHRHHMSNDSCEDPETLETV